MITSVNNESLSIDPQRVNFHEIGWTYKILFGGKALENDISKILAILFILHYVLRIQVETRPCCAYKHKKQLLI